MRKDLLASLTSKIAVGIAAVLLTAGTGGAVVFSNANHESPGPNENANEHAVENHNDDHDESGDDEATDDVESEDAEGNEDAEANENANNEHGKLVSEAAHADGVGAESNCRNHGQMVSAVARGVECDDDAQGASAESHGKSDEDHGKSDEEHPPADAGSESSDDNED